MLTVDKLNACYGQSHVLHDVSLHLPAGRLLALLGRNGAGKSTWINCLMGLLPPRSGSVRLQGRELAGCTPEQICRAGLGLVPQGRRIFPSLTVKENLEVARQSGSGGKWNRDAVCRIFPRLAERQHQMAGSLSGGEQQMLAIGRALMTNPRVLMLDEPSEGLAPQIVHEVGDALAALKAEMSILLVEQNLGLALRLADELVVLNTGRMVFAGSREEYGARAAELQAHLGVH